MTPGPDLPLLSICIPTWNRRAMLGVCLDSIVLDMEGVAPGRVEVVVSDNASPDGTEAYGRSMAERHPFIRYARNPTDLHIANFNTVVGLARGTFCWLLGDDDALLPGVLAKLLEALASGHDVYLGPRIACDKDLNPSALQRWHDGAPEADWDLGTAQERIRYFNVCTTMGGIFAFISAQVFRRALWETVPLPEGPLTGRMYLHVYRLLAFAGTSLRLRLLDFPLVLGRVPDLENKTPDFRRTTYDLDSMLEVASALGYRWNRPVWDAFFGVIRRNHCGDHYPRMIRLQAPDEAAWEACRPKLVQIGYAPPYLDVLVRAHRVLPAGILPLLALPAGTDLGVTVALEHMAFLLRGLRAAALVSLGPAGEARAAEELGASLRRACPGLRLLFIGTLPPESLAPGDRFLEVDPGTLEGDAPQQQALTQAGRDLEAGLVLNTGWPRTRASDVACALLPAFARLGLPGPDPRLDALYTAVLPREVLAEGPEGGCEGLRLALGVASDAGQPGAGPAIQPA